MFLGSLGEALLVVCWLSLRRQRRAMEEHMKWQEPAYYNGKISCSAKLRQGHTKTPSFQVCLSYTVNNWAKILVIQWLRYTLVTMATIVYLLISCKQNVALTYYFANEGPEALTHNSYFGFLLSCLKGLALHFAKHGWYRVKYTICYVHALVSTLSAFISKSALLLQNVWGKVKFCRLWAFQSPI